MMPVKDTLLSVAVFVMGISVAWPNIHAQDYMEENIPSQSQVEDFGSSFGVAPENSARAVSKSAIELIKHFEGWENKAYDDPSGYCTIGFGHLISLKKCKETKLEDRFSVEIDEKVGEEILEEDTRSARISVQKLVKVNLNDDEFGALVAFTFNVGKANFGNSTLLKLLNVDERKKAAQQLNLWTKSKGKVLTGLVSRRSCERALFEGAKVLDQQGRFSRSSCTSFGAAPVGSQLIDIDIGE